MNSRKRILIADDEQINLEFFDVMLTKLGFIVEKAEDGEAVLEKVKRLPPDLIILDNIMPKISGWEVTKTLKADPAYREIPIIMFSAMSDIKDKVEGYELGVDDYITKPYNFSVVLARIRAVLRNRELLGQLAAREARLSTAEELSLDVKKTIEAYLEGIGELEALTDRLSGPETQSREAFLELAKAVKEKTGLARKHIADLESRIERTLREWDALKQKEIGLQALEGQIRRENRTGDEDLFDKQ